MWQPQGFYNEYTLRTPALLSGNESVRGLYNYPSGKIAIIHGSSFQDRELFQNTFSKRDVCFVDRSWLNEPDLDGLRGTIKKLEKFKPDTIIAVGGGSVIDGAKLCRLFYEFPYFDQKKSRIDGEMLKTNFIVVPTTIGSGAEISSAAVFVDRNNHRKDMVIMHELQPDVIVYDPRYVSGTPKRLLCASALDAMAHIIEGYVSNVNNLYMNVVAETGLSLLHDELGKLLEEQYDSVDYSRLQYAGYIGGMVQNHCIVGAAHGVAHQLTEQGYSHGEAIALLLPAVIETNSNDTSCKMKYERLAKQSGFKNAEDMIGFVRKVADCSRIFERKDKLKDYLLKAIESIEFCDNVINDRGGKGNPIEITKDYLKNMIGSM